MLRLSFPGFDPGRVKPQHDQYPESTSGLNPPDYCPASCAGSLADRLFCDAGVRVRYMETVPLDIVQAFFHMDAGLLLTAHQLECFEGGPRSVLNRKVATLAVARKAEYTTFTSKDMNLHDHLDWLAVSSR